MTYQRPGLSVGGLAGSANLARDEGGSAPKHDVQLIARSGASAAGVLAVVAATMLFPSTARAYIDPGAGSIILQALLAALVALGVIAKIYWFRIKDFVSRIFSRSSATPENEGSKQPPREQKQQTDRPRTGP